MINYPDRTIFCHPSDRRFILENVLSKDINVLITTWLQKGHYIASKDIVREPKLSAHYEDDDFEKNKITIVATHTFK